MADVNPLVHHYYLADIEKSARARLRPAPVWSATATRAGDLAQRVLALLRPAFRHRPPRPS